MISKAFRIPCEDILLGTVSKVALMNLFLGFSEPAYDVKSKNLLALPWSFLYGDPLEETEGDSKNFLQKHPIQNTYRWDA